MWILRRRLACTKCIKVGPWDQPHGKGREGNRRGRERGQLVNPPHGASGARKPSQRSPVGSELSRVFHWTSSVITGFPNLGTVDI